MTQRTIYALADCNNFYCSVERVFAPQYRNRPVVVLSNNDGCIIARSNESKTLPGIKMGTPYFQMRHLVKPHGIIVFSSNYTLYGDFSQRVTSVLEQFTPRLEKYSIDESFLDLTHVPAKERAAYARHIRETVNRWTHIPISIGIAPTKTLAKLANKIAKKDLTLDGVLDLTDHPGLDAYLKAFPVEDVWGIGRQHSAFLAKHGITTAFDLTCAPQKWVQQHMTVTGRRTVLELNGTSCIPLELVPPPKKELIASRAFGEPITELAELKEAVTMHVERVAEKLRRQSGAARRIQVFIHTNYFKPDSPQYANATMLSLPVATADTLILTQYALYGLAKIFKSGYAYKKAGVMLMDLAPQSEQQLSFLGPAMVEQERRLSVMAALDEINARYGRGTLRVGSGGIERRWAMKRSMLSPRYTTCAAEFLRAS